MSDLNNSEETKLPEAGTNAAEATKEEVSIFKELIPFEQAKKEVVAWLDFKRIKPSMRVRNAYNIGVLIEAVMYGDITINPETFVITHTLNFPIMTDEKEVYLDKLTYKARLGVLAVAEADKSGSELTLAIGAALTGQPAAIIGKMDSVDGGILGSIGIFFTH